MINGHVAHTHLLTLPCRVEGLTDCSNISPHPLIWSTRSTIRTFSTTYSGKYSAPTTTTDASVLETAMGHGGPSSVEQHDSWQSYARQHQTIANYCCVADSCMRSIWGARTAMIGNTLAWDIART